MSRYTIVGGAVVALLIIVPAVKAEAEREKRAKIIHADGERQASVALAEAGDRLAASPASLKLRYLQTLMEMASEQNATILPIPLDMLRHGATALDGR